MAASGFTFTINTSDHFASQTSSIKPTCKQHYVETFTVTDRTTTGTCSYCGAVVVVDSEALANKIVARSKTLVEEYAAFKLDNTPSDADIYISVDYLNLVRFYREILQADADDINVALDRLSIIERDIMNVLNEDMVDLQL